MERESALELLLLQSDEQAEKEGVERALKVLFDDVEPEQFSAALRE